MPTEPFAIEEADTPVCVEFTVGDGVHVLDWARSILDLAGWTEIDAEKATYRLDLPYGMPVTEVPDPLPPLDDIYDGPSVVRYTLYDQQDQVQDYVRFVLYNPYTQDPQANDEIVWVAISTTVAGTLSNLTSAISANTGLSVTDTYEKDPPNAGAWVVELEADDGGTPAAPYEFGGLTELGGSSYWVAAHYTGGAGWAFEETYASGTLTLHLLVDVSYPSTLFRFEMSTGAVIDIPIPHVTPHPEEVDYVMVASRYQFFLWNPDHQLANVMACLPYLWSGKLVTSAAVVAGGLGWRNIFVWSGSWCAVACNEGFTGMVGAPDANRFSGIACSFNTGPLAYAVGDDLIENALVMAPLGNLADSEDSRVIGKIWNAFIQRRDATLGTIIGRDEHAYMCVARNGSFAGPVASLWVRIS